MVSCHRISSSREDGWVSPHKTMIPTKQWRLGSVLTILHVLHELGHPSHHLLSCLMMGFIPLKYICPWWYLPSWRWWWQWIVLVVSTPFCYLPWCGTLGVNHPIHDTSLDMFQTRWDKKGWIGNMHSRRNRTSTCLNGSSYSTHNASWQGVT